MGMAVKGPVEHRLIRRAIDAMMKDPALSADDHAACTRLRDRADRGIDRITARRAKRALRAAQPEPNGYGHGV